MRNLLKAVCIVLYSMVQLIRYGLNGQLNSIAIIACHSINFSIRHCPYSITCFAIAPIRYQLAFACLLYLVLSQLQLRIELLSNLPKSPTVCQEARPRP
jgi:hypothetical protein